METEYLLKKYNEDFSDSFQTWINPKSNYIPKCSICEENFINFKKELESILSLPEYKQIIEWSHPKGCLWYDYFINKVKELCPNVKITRCRNK